MELAVRRLRDRGLKQVAEVRTEAKHLVERHSIFLVDGHRLLVRDRVVRTDEIRKDSEDALGIFGVLGIFARLRLDFVRQILRVGCGSGRSLVLRRLLGWLRLLGRGRLTLLGGWLTGVLRVRARE